MTLLFAGEMPEMRSVSRETLQARDIVLSQH